MTLYEIINFEGFVNIFRHRAHREYREFFCILKNYFLRNYLRALCDPKRCKKYFSNIPLTLPSPRRDCVVMKKRAVIPAKAGIQ